MKWTFLVALLFNNYLVGQCLDFDKLETGGTVLSRTHNRIPFEIKFKDSIYYDDIFYPFDIKYIEKYADNILSKAQAYIIDRGGEKFFKNLTMESLEVNYPETVKADYENTALYELDHYDVKYWVKYYYRKNGYKYVFGLYFDRTGNLISEHKFPELKRNLNFENYTNHCEALNLVRNKRRFKGKKVDFIELAYVDEINSFCWLIKERKFPEKLGVFKHNLDLYFVNANTNKLEKVMTEQISGIACGIEVKKKKKRTK